MKRKRKSKNKPTALAGKKNQPKKNKAKREKQALRQGILHLHRDGYGFVLAAKEGEEDVFVPAAKINDALNTDLVEVEVFQGRKGKKEGRIINVLQRNMKTLIGQLSQGGKHWCVIPDDERIKARIFISNKNLNNAKHGENVIVQITSYPDHGEAMWGEVLETIGQRGEASTEAIAVMVRHQLPLEFPDEVRIQADAAVMNKDDYDKRVDLRELNFITIDGETAKDFDDAICVCKLKGNIIRLRVSIADVSHFVRPRSALDTEAYERATSVYFPTTVLPMLPEALSNNLCSLRPHEDRFTMTAIVDIDSNGEVVKTEFCSSVINSKRRCTYTEIGKLLIDKDKQLQADFGELYADVCLMEECHNRLRKKRAKRGTIDFDLPEPQIIIDLQGEVENIVKSERHVAHMIIEEFMIAANEAVAEFLTERGTGCIYRIHDDPNPEKLQNFSILMHNLGHNVHFGDKVAAKKLGKIVNLVAGKPEERLVNHSLLRSMAKAVYSVENIGHFGLASQFYCHFTSPIRRYPDLVVHRLLKQALATSASTLNSAPAKQAAKKHRGTSAGSIGQIAEHCSRQEKRAVDAEREMLKVQAALFMQEKVGEEFSGVVSHIMKFGFFVELIDYFIEGKVPITSLEGEYKYIEEHMRLSGPRNAPQFRIGDKVKIKVEKVDVTAREIIFQFLA